MCVKGELNPVCGMRYAVRGYKKQRRTVTEGHRGPQRFTELHRVLNEKRETRNDEQGLNE
jgi:hypothetical protein